MDLREEGKELRSAGELDDETIARKRSRRVSFAETTAVHVFDRDEDFETPPDSKPASTDSPGPAREVVGFQGEQSDSDDSKGFAREEGEDDEDEDGEQERFVRDMDSSSPGSAVGSVTSNDDDNFFGPVSTSFIRSGRLSEAGISDDENHDVTLDSTTFSLHFRNLAPPDDRTTNSAGSIRTPTGDTVPADSGNRMVPARSMKLLSRSKLSDGKLSGSGGGSSNMSLIVDDTGRYDYAKLSPTSEALLNEVNKCMQSSSPNGYSRIMTSDEHIGVVVAAKESGKDEGHVSDAAALDDVVDDCCVGPHLSKDVSMGAVTELVDNEPLSPTMKADLPMDYSNNEKTKGTASPKAKGYCKGVHEAIQSDTVEATAQNSDMLSPPYRGSGSNFILQSAHVHQALFKDQLSESHYFSSSSPLSAREVPVPALMIADGQQQQQQQQLESDRGMHTPKNAVQPFESPSQGSVSTLRAKRQRLFLDSAVHSVGKSIDSSAREQPPSSLELELVKHGERISAIKNSMSKFTIPETPIFSNPRVATPRKDHLPREPEGTLDRVNNDPSTKLVGLPVLNMEENFTSSVRKNRVQGMSVELNHPRNDIRELTHSEKYEASGETIKLNEAASSSNPETKINQSPLISQSFTEEVFILGEHGSSPRQTMIKLKENSLVSDSVHKVDHQDFHAVQESTSVQDVDLFGKKRRIEQNLIMDEDRASKTSRTEKSPNILPKVAVGGSGFLLGSQGECNNEDHDFGGQSPVTHWTNMFTKVSEATKLAFSPSIHSLSLQALDTLEDMLAELQMARKYERFSASLRNHDRLGDLHHQRVAEVRSLQDKLLYEHAKLQLRHVKLDQLRNKAQLTQSGIRKCCNLKLMFSQLSLPSTRASKTKEDHLHSDSSISSSKNQEQHSRVISMRQEVKMLEQKVACLMKSLGACCKIKGNLNCDEIIKAANEHLEKRKSCRIIHQYLQLWELSDMVKSNDQHDIVLNYCNLLFQRFTVNGNQTSSMVAKISLNDSNIEKTFPNMNACAAFEFVFKAKGDHRLFGSKCLQQKTLETSLLLGTLVDVLEEVQVARMELLNLTHLAFHSQPCQLELQLCFMNIRRGWKVTLILDMTNLNCAVYPSEPYELQFKISGTQTTLPLSVSNEILAALQSLQVGHSMITRFCRLISQAVRACSG